MATKIPQFEDTQPVLNVQRINSKAGGFEAFAKAFGEAASGAATELQKVEVEKSNAMFMQSANQVEEVKSNAQIQMIQNPNNALKIAENSHTTYDSIKESAYVNKEDRQKLDYMINRSRNDIDVKATETNFTQAKRGIAIKFWDSYPVTMHQIEEALNKNDLKTAKDLEDALHANSMAAASIGAITPEQFGTIRKSSLDLYEKTQDLLKMSQDLEGVAAHEYHAAYMSPFGSNSFDNLGHPGDVNTAWMADHLNYDRTMQGQLNALYNGQPINYAAVAAGGDHDYEKFKMALYGVNQVKGAISSGMPFNQIDAKINTLESKTNLNEIETGQIKYWKSFKNRLDTDNSFYGTLGQNVDGAKLTQNHQAEGDAIMTSGKSGAELFSALRQNDNMYMGKMVDLAFSMHMDPHLIKPVPVEWVNEVKSSFQKDAPVLPALQRIAYVDPEFRAYLADAMPKPNQAMAVWIAGNTLDHADPSFQADLIAANQETVANKDEKTPSSLILSADAKPNEVWNDILNADRDMKSLYSYLGRLPGGKASQDGFRQMALNYVYDQAQRRGDYDLKNQSDYVETFAANTLKGFNLYQTDKANINLNDISLARTQDADVLVSYVLSEAYKNIHIGQSEVEFQRSLDLNPLMVVSTPDRRLVVIDRYGRAAVTPDGHEAFDMPYTSNMLSAANALKRKSADYLANYGGSDEFTPDEVTPITPEAIMIHAEGVKERRRKEKRNAEIEGTK